MKHAFTTSPHVKLDTQPTTRELRWFAQIDRHGPQSSEYLYECTRDTHRCRDTSLRRLQALREAGYLRLPPQQDQIAKADFNPYVYDLTKLGWDRLADHKDPECNCRPTGHWWHGYWVSAVTSAVEIAAIRTGLTYVPAAQILAVRGVEMSIPVSGTKLIPDQLFAIRYPDGYRAFALEVDRGTEPVQSSPARKSLRRTVAQYREVLERKSHKEHYGIKSNLAVLWVFNCSRREAQFRELESEHHRQVRTVALVEQFPRYQSVAALLGKLVGL